MYDKQESEYKNLARRVQQAKSVQLQNSRVKQQVIFLSSKSSKYCFVVYCYEALSVRPSSTYSILKMKQIKSNKV